MDDNNIKLLLIEDSETDISLINKMLKAARKTVFHVEIRKTLAKCLELIAEDGNTDVILLDLTLPDSFGIDTFTRIHAHAPNIPIIIITASGDEQQAMATFQKGAQDYLVKGEINTELLERSVRYAIERKKAQVALFNSEEKLRHSDEELERANKELIKSNKKLSQMVLKDVQTGLYNHRYLAGIIEAEFYRAKRYNTSLSVVMIDVDYFKSINELYGHQFGDLVLRQLAQQIKKIVRRYDIVIRYGGEEFIIISPGADRGQALILAQRILDTISVYNFGNKKNTVKLKITLAAVSYPEDKVANAMDLVKLADQVMAKAKEEGGNRVWSSADKKKSSRGANQPIAGKGVDVLKERIEKLNKQANQNLIESIFAFAKTIELKDHYTGEHVEKTVKYATNVAEALGLPRTQVEMVREAAILHDLGKIGISDQILTKKGGLTKAEFEEIKRHPKIAADILRPIHVLSALIPLILYHHERWDGKGYPHGLKGDEIPLGARIIAIADVYQALISNRPYRKAFPRAVALRMIKEGAGTQFDPKIVDKFLNVLKMEEQGRSRRKRGKK